MGASNFVYNEKNGKWKTLKNELYLNSDYLPFFFFVAKSTDERKS